MIPITFNQIIVLAVSNIISGIFIGLGIAVGIYSALKKQMPKWIKEISDELTKLRAIDKALSSRR